MVRKKTDPFWVYVEERPNERWRCKFCGSEYSGRASRIKAHFGQVKNRGIEVCHAVDPFVKQQALSALHLDCTDEGQTSLTQSLVKETTQNDDKEIEAENFENFHHLSEFHFFQDGYQSVYDEHGSRENPPAVMPLPLSVEFQDGETDFGTFQMEFQPDVSLPNLDITNVKQTSPQENMAAGASGETLIENVLNLHQSGMDMLQQSGRSIDEKLYCLKRKLEELMSQTKEKEEELCHLWKKAKAMKYVYESIKGDRKHSEFSPFQQVNQVEELIAEVEELRNPGAKRSSRSVRNTKGAPLVTTEPIGRQSEISKIWNHIITNEIVSVGVYGMGGVGKTGIMMQIYNKLLEYEAFDNVFWATMPRDFTIYELQDVIGNAVHLDELPHEKNEKIRASMLYRFLTTGKKFVLILDGLWQHFDFDNVGIPTGFDGLKLIITSRSLDVCRMMLCQAKIKIQCLSAWRDKWNIFLDKLRPTMVLSTKVKEIAEQIVSTYGGLPLYISTIARRMRGVENMHEWKDMMEKMRDPNARCKELKNEVIDPLKLSYDFLADEQLQQCFIYCAFYIGKRKSRIRRQMIEFLIDVGLVSGMDKRQKLYDKANTILDKLENACLLESVNSIKGGDEVVMKMHDAIIDMASHCAGDMIPCMGNFGIGAKNILSEESSFEGLDDISYVMDGREETPNRSPCCSRLSILIFHGESCLEIPSSISILLPKLRIFDLSETKIDKIPDFVGDLVNLTALVLRGCSVLEHIPCLQKLRLLRKLDLYHCRSMRNIPDGLESLVNLEYLDLYGTCIKELPGRVLSNFAKLQYLKVNYIEAEELVGLHELETLCCCFPTAKELTRYLLSLTDKGPTQYLIFVGRLEFSFHQRIEMQANHYSKAIVLNEPLSMNTENYKDCFLLPKNVEILLIFSWASKLIMLSNSFPLENLEALEIHNSDFGVVFGDEYQGFQFPNSLSSPFPNLKRINMSSCPELKYLLALSLDSRLSLPVLQDNMRSCASFEGTIATSPVQKHTCDFHCIETNLLSDFNNMRSLVPESLSVFQNLKKIEILNSNIRILLTTEMFLHLRNLEEIDVRKCPCLEEIIMPASREVPLIAPSATSSSQLTSLHIRECNMMKRLLDHKLLIYLCHLQTIDVSDCKKLEEIASTYNERNNTVPVLTSLPSLKTLRLMYLTQLTSIGTMKIDTPIEIIEVIHCPKIRRIPLYLSLLPDKLRAPHSLKKIYVSEQDWWDSLEWESREVKTLLQPYVELKVRQQ